MRYAVSTATFAPLIVAWVPSSRASDYGATNETGVRVFSAVPEVGVHPRVLMSPGGFSLKLDEGKYEWKFTVNEDGRSRSRLRRGGEDWQID